MFAKTLRSNHLHWNSATATTLNAQPQTLQLQSPAHLNNNPQMFANDHFAAPNKMSAPVHGALAANKQTPAGALALSSRRNSKQPVSLTIVAPNLGGTQNNRLLIRNGDITKQDIDVMSFDASVPTTPAGAVT